MLDLKLFNTPTAAFNMTAHFKNIPEFWVEKYKLQYH